MYMLHIYVYNIDFDSYKIIETETCKLRYA